MTKAVSLARSVSNTGLLLDGDLSAIAQLAGTSGLLQKTAANTWQLDTTTYATLVGGVIPSNQLPGYVDDVLEYTNQASLPASGETGKLYLTLDNNKVYRWSGSTYVEIVASPSSSDSVPEGSTNLYFTNARVRSAISVTGSGSYDSSTGVITVTGGVTSVNGSTGSVTLTTTNINEGTNQYYTNARARGALSVTAGTGLNYNNATGVFELASIPNNSLANSSITINGTSVSLGGTATINVNPGGSTGNVQFNSSGSFSGSNNLFWDSTNSRLGIGTNSPGTTLHVAGGTNINGSLSMVNTTNGIYCHYFGTVTNGNITVYNAYNNTDPRIIFYGGTGSNLTYHTNNLALYPGTDLGLNIGMVNNRWNNMYVNTVNASGDVITNYSDTRLKDIIGPITNAVNKIKTLTAFYYRPNNLAKELGQEDKVSVGLSAQQVQAIQPQTIHPSPIDAKYLTIQYERLVPLLIAAIQEQQQEIEELRSLIGE